MKRLLYILILLLALPTGIVFGQARINMNGAYVVNNNVYVVVVDKQQCQCSVIDQRRLDNTQERVQYAGLEHRNRHGNHAVVLFWRHYPALFAGNHLNISTAGSRSGSVKFSTYHTVALNSSQQTIGCNQPYPFSFYPAAHPSSE